ncbi:MAG: Cna B-type domain-containing protein, partial [Firmicutes bacterium]|nr:Cna B-type domain-containing protein [Bacillota bacterium]
WSTEGNKGGAGQQDGRNLSQFTTEGFPRYVAPYNKKGANDVLTDGNLWGTASCYDGGTWNVQRIDSDTIRYTIKNYKFNSAWFPAQNGLLLDWRYDANIYWDPRMGIENSCHIGCFSAAELWVVLPLISPDGERLEDHKAPNGAEYGSGIETFFVEDSSLVATSASGVNVGYRDANGNYYVGEGEPGDGYTQVTDTSNQERTSDDKLSFTAETYKWTAGTYSASVKYSSPSITDLYWIYDASSIPGITKVGPAQANGRDVAEISQPISFWWRTSVGLGKNSDVLNSSYGTNALVLFDDAGVRLNSEAGRMSNTEHSGYQRSKFLFAAKPDGTGWKHYGLKPDSTDENGTVWYYDEATGSITTDKKTYLAYDYEQTTAQEGDLVYYTSYADLVADGKVCVGVLGEARSLTKSSSTKYATFKNLIKVRDDAMMGYVYQIDIKSRAWTAKTYEDAGLSVDTDGDIVSRMDIQNGTATTEQQYFFEHPTYRGNQTKYYVKSTYNETGVYTGGHSPHDTVRGDSLYIIPFRPSITKYILQVKESGTTKEVYNMDENQNIVDFRLSTKLYQRVPNESDFVSTTTLIVKDTLPKGVTYNEDAMLGGTYTKSATPGYHGSWSGGALPGETYELTLANGQTYTIEFPEPEVVTNTNGVTTLTFRFADFPVGADPIDIFYSVTIDNSAENGQTYTNVAEVDTSDVHLLSDEVYETRSEVDFSVIRTFTISLSKLTEKSFVDISAQIGYTMAWQNVGNNDVTNAPMIDTLPYNGDGNGTSFSGTYTLSSVKLTNNNGTKTSPIKDFTGLRVFYTTDTAVRDIDVSLWKDDSIQSGSVTDLDGNTFSCQWTEATVNADGTVTGIDPNATAFCILGPLKSKKMVEAACVIDPSNNEPGDKYVNAISIKGSITIARGIVLNRILSGLAWYDENFDGARQATEKKLAGITVKLVNKSDFEDAVGPGDHQSPAPAPVPQRSSSTVTGIAPAINLRGEECVTTTGTDGKYEFAYLAAGEYVAIFMDGETVLSDFYMSPLEADTAREVNNSNTILVAADEEGHVDYGYLYVTMPQADDIKASPYMIRNEDMGLVEAINIYAEKKWQTADGGEEPPEGAKITFTLTGGGNAYSVELDGTPDDPLEANAIGAFESAAWYATFQNLPKYDVDDTGKTVEIEYELTESVKWPAFTDTYSDNAGALTEGDVGTVTNTETTMEVLVKKAWQNADGTTTPPEGAQVTFTLYADGEPTGYSVPLDGTPDEEITGAGGFEAKPWNALFRKLPKYKVVEGEATEIQYTVEESGQWPGYTVVYPDATQSFAVSGDTITNVQKKTELSVIKAWKNVDGTTTAPEGAEVTFTLLADEAPTSYTVTLDGTADTTVPTGTGGYESEAWKATFVNLPKYKIVNGQEDEITYTVKETGTWAGYEAIYEGEEAVSAIADGVITNQQVGTKIVVTKAWLNADGTSTPPEGAEVTFTLYADGQATDYTVTLDGNPETTAPAGTGGYESEAWKAAFINLPKEKNVDGTAVAIDYTVVESGSWLGYQISYPGGETATYATNNTTITNYQKATEISVTKAWAPIVGDVPRGANVEFTLWADGQATNYTVTLDGTADPDPEGTGGYESEAWKASFVNLPKYRVENDQLVEIGYTVTESGQWPGYTVSYGDNQETFAVDGGTITNTEVMTGLSVTKVWKNADGSTTAPDGAKVTFTLYADGQPTNFKVELVGIDNADSIMQGGQETPAWTASFVRLPKYRINDKDEAVEIVYTVEETGTWPGYTVSYGDNQETFAVDGGTITNEQITTEIGGFKTWSDDDFFVDGVPVNGYQRPESITIDLLADGTVIDSVTVTEDDEWEYEFTDLPKYKIVDGQAVEIEYTVAEETVPGYAAVV